MGQARLRTNQYKTQESALILLNIGVIAALFFVHIGFISLLGRPTMALLLTLAIRFVILIFELLWVQRLTETTSLFAIDVHIHFSIILNIVFAFMAAISGGTADSHYSVLMILPILSAAYHFSLVRTLLITTIIAALTFLEVSIYFSYHPPIDVSEYFEAATVSLVFLVVALVVWFLVGNLRSEEEKLNASLIELRLLQEKLVAEEKLAAVGQLSSSIAHEIRNPVTMIASSLKMAEKYEQGSPIRTEMFNIATAEAKRLESLTTEFLAFARSKKPELKSVNVYETLEYIASLAKASLAEKNIVLKVTCPRQLFAPMDGSLIHQALLNLLTNAINAARQGDEITIGGEKRESLLILYIEGQGSRIPDEIAEKIFEPFYTSGPKGTGLGLPIVRNIARAHGGDVFLANNENGNVRFEIRF